MIYKYVSLMSHQGHMYALREDGTLFRIVPDHQGGIIFVLLGKLAID